jgi:hypothetical protein
MRLLFPEFTDAPRFMGATIDGDGGDLKRG